MSAVVAFGRPEDDNLHPIRASRPATPWWCCRPRSFWAPDEPLLVATESGRCHFVIVPLLPRRPVDNLSASGGPLPVLRGVGFGFRCLRESVTIPSLVDLSPTFGRTGVDSFSSGRLVARFLLIIRSCDVRPGPPSPASVSLAA